MKKSKNTKALQPGVGLLVMSASMKWQRASSDALRSFGLTPIQLLLLAGIDALSIESDPVTQASVARRVGSDVMLTSKHVRELERKNLVARKPHPTDTRARSLHLTKTGITTYKKASKTLNKIDSIVFGSGKSAEKMQKNLRDDLGWSQ